MVISSDAFPPNGEIPRKYTCEGENINPPLVFADIPPEAVSLALILEDPDAPGKVFTHWVLYDMPAAAIQIVEGQPADIGKVGMNDFGTAGYSGPCPPSGTHRYVFHLYALDMMIDLPEGISKADLLSTAEGHIIESAELVGVYTKTGL